MEIEVFVLSMRLCLFLETGGDLFIYFCCRFGFSAGCISLTIQGCFTIK